MSADDLVKLISAIAGAVVIVLAAIGALWQKVHEYQENVNGRLGELLAVTRTSARQEGVLAAHPEIPVTESGVKGAPEHDNA